MRQIHSERAPVQGDGGVAARPQQADVLDQALHAAGQVVVRQHVAHLQLPLRRHAALHRRAASQKPTRSAQICSVALKPVLSQTAPLASAWQTHCNNGALQKATKRHE